MAESEYWTVRFAQVPSSIRTKWHPYPDDAGGPFQTIVRGAFGSADDAARWADSVAPLGGWEIVPVGGHNVDE